MADLELGQMLFSNNDWHQHEAYWATDGLNMIAQVIAELRGEDPYGGWTTLTSNSGAEEFVNDIFEMRCYCWCDSTWEEDPDSPHAKGCPPNFLYKPTGLMISWYKHAGRGITCNKQSPGIREWFKIVNECIESIK